MSRATPATWAGSSAEVVLGDDVGAAGRRVGLDGLAVAEDQDDQHRHHGEGDRQHVAEGQRGRCRRHRRAGCAGSPRWRRPSTTGRRRRTRRGRSACRGARGRAGRCASACPRIFDLNRNRRDSGMSTFGRRGEGCGSPSRSWVGAAIRMRQLTPAGRCRAMTASGVHLHEI